MRHMSPNYEISKVPDETASHSSAGGLLEQPVLGRVKDFVPVTCHRAWVVDDLFIRWDRCLIRTARSVRVLDFCEDQHGTVGQAVHLVSRGDTIGPFPQKTSVWTPAEGHHDRFARTGRSLAGQDGNR